MNGSGCKTCPVKPCGTMNYRGSTCAAQRAKYGLGDPKTNADKIRGMSDEELAERFASLFEDQRFGIEYSDDAGVWLHWLQQPAEG